MRRQTWTGPLVERGRWLGRPWFLAAVAVLAVNDHVLKARFPGWWTGKVSDLAGVAVVATLAAVLVGRRAGVAAASIGFLALKAAPGVADLAAPILGGPTRRDVTDLVALAVLVPLWPVLRTRSVRPTGPVPPPVEPGALARRRRAGAAVLPILGALTSLVATTATSCAPEPSVSQVAVVGGDAYAHVGAGDDGWARSRDGGATWTSSAAPPGVPTGTTTPTSTTDPAGATASTDTAVPGAGPATPVSCGDAGCFRVGSKRQIERADDRAGPWRTEAEYDDDDLHAFDGPCTGGDALGTLAAGDEPGSPVLAGLGTNGVAVRQADGTWERRAVLGADRGGPRPDDRIWLAVAAVVSVLGVVGAVAVGRRASPERVVGALVPPAVAMVLVAVHVVRSFAGDDRFGPVDVGFAVVAAAVGTSIAARSRRASAAPPAGPGAGWPPTGSDPRPPPPLDPRRP